MFRSLGTLLAMAILPVVSFAEHAALQPGDVVAVRGGVELTVDLVDQEVRKMPPEVRKGYFDDPDRVARVIDSLLLTKQLAEEAMRQGIELDDVDTTAGSEDELSRLNALANAVARRHSEKLDGNVDYAVLAKERYRARKSHYASSERFVLRNLFVDASIRGDIAAEIIAEAAHARAMQGEDFLSLIAAYDEGQEVETVTRTFSLEEVMALPGSTQSALMKISNPYGVSEVIKEQGGFRIVQLVERLPPEVPPYEQVREQIIGELKQEAQIGARTTFLRTFSLQDVELNDAVVRKLAERYRDSALLSD